MYEQYAFTDWLLFFYIYCFLGWCIESTYVSIQKRKFVNRGFMRGPFLPIYGSGAIVMLFVTIPVRDNLFLTFLFGAIGASILEYFTGAAMEALFQVRYWDYSKQPFNLNGHICLGTSLAWGGLTILMVHVLHEPVERVVLSLNPYLRQAAAFLLSIVIASDFALSFRAALDIKDMLAKMTKAREELEKIQTRLDAIIAFSGRKLEHADHTREKLMQQAGGAVGRISQNLSSVKSRLDFIQQLEDSDLGIKLSQFKDELEQIRSKYVLGRHYHSLLRQEKHSPWRPLLNAHPTITSPKFEEALKELKEIAEEKRKKKNH